MITGLNPVMWADPISDSLQIDAMVIEN